MIGYALKIVLFIVLEKKNAQHKLEVSTAIFSFFMSCDHVT